MGPIASVTMARSRAASVTASRRRSSSTSHASAARQDDGAPGGAQPNERGGDGLGPGILEQVGAQLDDVGAGGRGERVELGLPSSGDDARRTLGELERADGGRAAHRARCTMGADADKARDWLRPGAIY